MRLFQLKSKNNNSRKNYPNFSNPPIIKLTFQHIPHQAGIDIKTLSLHPAFLIKWFEHGLEQA